MNVIQKSACEGLRGDIAHDFLDCSPEITRHFNLAELRVVVADVDLASSGHNSTLTSRVYPCLE